MFKLEENINLKNLNSFGISTSARYRLVLDDVMELPGILKTPRLRKVPKLITGSGTNILFVDDFPGCLIAPEIPGIRICEENEGFITLEAGAGIEWDKLVEWAVDNNFYGIENLSLIPGKTGAALVQNIGAYGVEIADLVEEAEVYDMEKDEHFRLKAGQCKFSYRHSIFKEKSNEAWIVTRVKIRLSKKAVFNLYYGNLSEEVRLGGGPSLRAVRDSVIKIRRSKLPDHKITGNAGSFFKNPVISGKILKNIKEQFPDVPFYPDKSGDYFKIPAAWMIEKAGWKGFRQGDAGVYEKQALVIINHGSAGGRAIYKLAMEIKSSIINTFGIVLEPEVRIIMNQ